MLLMEGSDFPAARKGTVIAAMIFLKDLMWHCFSGGIRNKSILCLNELYMELVCVKRGTHKKYLKQDTELC